MSELPSRSPRELFAALEAAAVAAKADPQRVLIVRGWEYLLLDYERPQLGRPGWTRTASGYACDGVSVLPIVGEMPGGAVPGAWYAVVRRIAPEPRGAD